MDLYIYMCGAGPLNWSKNPTIITDYYYGEKGAFEDLLRLFELKTSPSPLLDFSRI